MRTLEQLREAIDRVDTQLLELLDTRAALACEVGEVKKRAGAPVFHPAREAQVIARMQEASSTLRPQGVAHIWREIMSACRVLEGEQGVAYLGPSGTFSEQAAETHFGQSMRKVACQSIDEVFRATVAGTVEYGVVPIENSTEGVIARTMDLLLLHPVHIVGQLSLKVQHNLLRLGESMQGIEVVYAHPQALAQCHEWLSANLPHAQRQAAASNAEGARLAGTNPAWAAIASERAAAEFALQVVRLAIQDEVHNRTRFAVICSPAVQATPEPTGRDAVSLAVSVPNVAGALHDLLVPLKRHGVSMTRLESRPARTGTTWEYHFFIDIEGHVNTRTVALALEELRAVCAFYKLLGCYPVGN